MKETEGRWGKPVPRNLKSFSVREDYSDLWQHRLTPSQMILDARYSMMCLVWREAGCKPQRSSRPVSLPDVIDAEKLVWHFFILCQISLLCSQTHLDVLNTTLIQLETHLDDLLWFMSTPEAFSKSLRLFTLLDVRRPKFHKHSTWAPWRLWPLYIFNITKYEYYLKEI